jgi:hypothetical protein
MPPLFDTNPTTTGDAMSRLIRKIAQLEQAYAAIEREIEEAQRTVQAYYDRGIRHNELPYVNMGGKQIRLDTVGWQLQESFGRYARQDLIEAKEIERDFGPFEDRELSMGLSISKSPGTEGFTVVTITDSATGLKTSVRGKHPFIPATASVTNAVRQSPYTQMLILQAFRSWLQSVDPVRSDVVEGALHKMVVERGLNDPNHDTFYDKSYEEGGFSNRSGSMHQLTDFHLKYAGIKAGIKIQPIKEFVKAVGGGNFASSTGRSPHHRTTGFSVTDMLAD